MPAATTRTIEHDALPTTVLERLTPALLAHRGRVETWRDSPPVGVVWFLVVFQRRTTRDREVIQQFKINLFHHVGHQSSTRPEAHNAATNDTRNAATTRTRAHHAVTRP